MKNMHTHKWQKSVFSLLIVFAMIFSMLPASVFASDPPTRTKVLDFTATSVEKQADNNSWGNPQNDNINAISEEGWAWYAQDDGLGAKALLLSGLNLSVSSEDALIVPDGTTIVLADGSTNTVVTDYGSGIYAMGDLTINSLGSNASLDVSGDSFGITCDAYNNTFTMNGGTLNASGDKGIDAFKNLSMTGGELNATGISGEGINLSGNFAMTGGAIKTIGTTNAMKVSGTVPTTGITIKGWNSSSNAYDIAAVFTAGSNKVIEASAGGSILNAKITMSSDSGGGDTTYDYTLTLDPTSGELCKQNDTNTKPFVKGTDYDYSAGVLTLKEGFAFTTSADVAMEIMPVTILVEGTASITSTSTNTNYPSAGIYASAGALTIDIAEGETFTVTGGSGAPSFGVAADFDFTKAGKGKLVAIGGDASASSGVSVGIRIDGGNFSMSDGTIHAKSTDAVQPYAMWVSGTVPTNLVIKQNDGASFSPAAAFNTNSPKIIKSGNTNIADAVITLSGDGGGDGDDGGDVVQRTKALNLTVPFLEKQADGTSWGNPQTTDIDALAVEGWKWETGDKKLTLDGLDLNFSTAGTPAILLPSGSTIVLDGENTVAHTATGNGISLPSGKLTIEGTGELTVTSSNGIAMQGLEMKGGTLRSTSTGSFGITCTGALTVTGGTIYAKSTYSAFSTTILPTGVTVKANQPNYTTNAEFYEFMAGMVYTRITGTSTNATDVKITASSGGGSGDDSGDGDGSGDGNSNSSNSSSSSSDSGNSSSTSGSSSSTSGSQTSSTPAVAPPSAETMTKAIDSAVQAVQAGTSGGGALNAVLKNVTVLTKENVASLIKKAEALGKKATISSDVMSENGKYVEVRVTLDPTLITKNVRMDGYTRQAQTFQTASRFNKHFENKTTVISLGQEGKFGQTAKISAKLDFKGFDTSNLYLYSYDKKTNQYRLITSKDYKIDKNGYLVFNTDVGGDIIVSNGALVRK